MFDGNQILNSMWPCANKQLSTKVLYLADFLRYHKDFQLIYFHYKFSLSGRGSWHGAGKQGPFRDKIYIYFEEK